MHYREPYLRTATGPQPLLAPPRTLFQFTAESGLPMPKPHAPLLCPEQRGAGSSSLKHTKQKKQQDITPSKGKSWAPLMPAVRLLV